MTAILAITFPIYAALALGYGVVWKGWFNAADMRSFGRYVLNIALPAMIFSALASRSPAEVFQPGYAAIYTLGGLITITLSYLLLTLRGTDPKRRALGVMGSTCPNNGFIGYPIMLLAFPDQAGLVLALNLTVENLVLIPICLLLVELADAPPGQRLLPRLGRILGDLAKMPMIIGLALGLLVSLSGVPLPGPLLKFVEMLAATAGALALLVIGGSLVGLPLHGNRALAAQISASKLLLHPALTALVAAVLMTTGIVTLSPALHSAVILSAAMPMFGIYTVLAQRQGLEGAASLAMLTATSGAFVTLTLLLWILV
ncbi:AEC family transporter [Pseudophaeobacter flagellatus]|uniref:AEC family transporter n=1 Tax=Pseudophaeobacter flagellatus TaxID=2899119 RepID=UPI001E51D817|nr:AEC family transporter [Pseudophaeobacter flagellatus]MCD9147236.1 AEC family transporter [Pseudophaeobacter flagellatus]